MKTLKLKIKSEMKFFFFNKIHIHKFDQKNSLNITLNNKSNLNNLWKNANVIYFKYNKINKSMKKINN